MVKFLWGKEIAGIEKEKKNGKQEELKQSKGGDHSKE
jgi:hypothetical protein